MTMVVDYKKGLIGAPADTGRGPSPSIWADWDSSEAKRNPSYGIEIFDDFLMGGVCSTLGYAGGWRMFSSTTFPFTYTAEPAGVLTATTAATADLAAVIASPSAPFRVTGSPSTSGKLMFEARFRALNLTTGLNAILLGLAETGAAVLTPTATVPLPADSTGWAISNTSCFLGFHHQEADGVYTFRTGYSDRATSTTAVADTEAVVGGGTAATANNVWVKLGMVYDPRGYGVTFYVNGNPLPTRLANATIAGLTTFDTVGLGLLFAAHTGATPTANDTFSLDWIRCAQFS